MSVGLCIVHHSGHGHTARQAAAVADGVRRVQHGECAEIPVAALFDAESSTWLTPSRWLSR